MPWTLNSTPLADLGIDDLTLRLPSRAPAVCSFSAPAPSPAADPALSDGLPITLKQGTITRFKGAIRHHAHAHTGADGRHHYHATDVWDDLARLIYRQSWAQSGGQPDAQTTFVRLYQNRDGQRISAAAQIQDILTYAAARGIPVVAGSIQLQTPGEAPLNPPWETRTDITCAEAIRAVLDWAPDAIAWIDYTPFTPTLNVKRAALATATGVNIATHRPVDIALDPRPDLHAPGVRIIYETTAAEGRVYATDTAGDPDLPRGIEQTITLDHQPAPGRPTQDILAEDLGDPQTLAWWQARFPWLPDNAIITGADITPANTDNLPRILLAGALQPWMQPSGKALAVVVTCTTSYTAGDYHDPHTGVHAQPLEVPLTLTNLHTRTYKGPTTPAWTEPIPDDLAANLYESVKTLPWEGRIVWIDADCDPRSLALGHRITLSGGRAAWSTMHAPVQEVIFAPATGRTEIRFGPPEHLAPQDWLELIRANRRRTSTLRIAERRDRPDDPDLPDLDDPEASHAHANPRRVPTAAPPPLTRLRITPPETNKDIDLNPADAHPDDYIHPRTINWTAPNGQKYRARIISSEPEELDPDDEPGGGDPDPSIPPECGHPGNDPGGGGGGGGGGDDDDDHPGTDPGGGGGGGDDDEHPGATPSPPCALSSS